jgi:predicted transcriptional regulator
MLYPPNSTAPNTLKLLRNYKFPKTAIKREHNQTCLSFAEREQFGRSQSTANKQIARFLNAGLLARQAHGNYTKKNR